MRTPCEPQFVFLGLFMRTVVRDFPDWSISVCRSPTALYVDFKVAIFFEPLERFLKAAASQSRNAGERLLRWPGVAALAVEILRQGIRDLKVSAGQRVIAADLVEPNKFLASEIISHA